MSDLIDNVYLPDFNKRSIRESDAYKLLKDNNKDTSVIEGYENHPDAGTVNFESFDKFLGEGGTKEEWIARHATPEVQKEFFSNVGDFMLETGKDTVLSLATAVVNGADVATNLMPLFVKALSKAPYAQIGIDESFLNEATEKQVYDFANNVSNNLGEARDYLNEFKKDDNFASQLIGVMSQDLLYSIPIYNKLRAAGVPKYPAFFISGGFGGAIGIEQKIMGAESTFSQEFFAKDIIELKNLIGIIPNTPEDKIADEVIQALEYGAFSAAIPGIIDAFKFMKQYVPAMTATTGATIGMTADNEAEGSPLKAIVNAVDNIPMFKSAVVDAADNIPTVASGDQIFNTIKNTTGVKESELKWMDLEGFLKGKNKVSKDEVLEYINTNKIDVAEVTMSSSSKKGLPDDFRQTIDEYETRWRDSDLADGVTPNYDVYKYKSTTYANANLVNRLGEETQASTRANLSKEGMDVQELKGDFQSMNRNPLLQAMDADAEIFGTGTSFKVLKSMLTPWMDDATGKYTGYLIDLKKSFGNATNTNYYVVSTSKNRVLVPEVSLDSIGEGNFTRIMKYEIDELELERFNIEDDIRQFRLNNTDQSPIYEKYTSPGGTEYTELVFKIKNKEGTTPAILEGEFGTLGNNKVKSAQRTSVNYTSPHFNKMNEFAHVRFKTRTLDNGKKVLAVEEMQSDLLQASKTELFDSANRATFNAPSGDKVLKDFPFKNSWYEFTIKRLTRYAADNGFDAIAIPKGSLAANRYGQSIEKLKRIEVEPFDANVDFLKGDQSIEPGFVVQLKNEKGEIFKSKNVVGMPGEANFFENMRGVLEKEVSSANYSEIQQMIIDATDTQQFQFRELDKVEIAGSGKGKFNLYDKTIPSYMKKYAKKWNAKVYDYRLSNPENPSIPVTVLELSDEMKVGVQSSSQPLFELFGGVSLATWGAQAVSDSMENNIISQKTN
jgi:hypothetical protein